MTDGYKLDQAALDALFFKARTFNGWQDKDVSEDTVKQIFDTMKWGPTSANCSPLRIVFVRTKEAKEKLKQLIDKGNQEKTMEAPMIALFATDREFYKYVGKLAPRIDITKWYVGKEEANKETAALNGTLQAGYFLLAARALGLDCGPMSGINRQGIKDAFFANIDGDVKFVCSLGYGRPETLYPRAERLSFDEACKIV